MTEPLAAPLLRLLEPVKRHAAATSVEWDAARFEELCWGPLLRLWRSLDGQPDALAVTRAYTALLQEAMTCGYLSRGGERSGERSVLERLLVERVPHELPGVPAGQRLGLLARVWNLGEGLLQEAAWLDGHVRGRLEELGSLAELGPFLLRVLEPVLEPGPAARWSGPFLLSVLDMRRFDEQFLPGEMFRLAPLVVCVRDRRRAVQFGVLLQPQGRSRLLGRVDGLPATTAEDTVLPVAAAGPGRVRIGGFTVELPFLHSVQHLLLVPAGFLVASAVDSQRLWILESP